MFNLESMYELINSYNQNFHQVKLMLEDINGKAGVSPEMIKAVENLKKVLAGMETGKILLKETQVLCELEEARTNNDEESIQELREMLEEF